jgi:Raf kinase inhibitor-like YbhB/YbcL family protein
MIVRTILAVALLASLCVLVPGCASESAETETQAEPAGQDDAAPSEDEGPVEEFTVSTAAYEDGSDIPATYCNVGVEGGENVSIPLTLEGIPEDAKSLALIMVDRHEVADEWVHWAVVDIPVTTNSIGEGESGSMPGDAWELNSTNGQAGYQGPQPPPGSGDHEYETIVFALDVANTEISENPTYAEFLDAMDAHHLAEASVSGYFGR